MRKILSVLLAFILSISFSGCALLNVKMEENIDSTDNALKQVMTAYSEYKDSILNANEALDASGYIRVSVSKDSLDRALQDLFREL